MAGHAQACENGQHQRPQSGGRTRHSEMLLRCDIHLSPLPCSGAKPGRERTTAANNHRAEVRKADETAWPCDLPPLPWYPTSIRGGLMAGPSRRQLSGSPAVIGPGSPLDRQLCAPGFNRVCPFQIVRMTLASYRSSLAGDKPCVGVPRGQGRSSVRRPRSRRRRAAYNWGDTWPRNPSLPRRKGRACRFRRSTG